MIWEIWESLPSETQFFVGVIAVAALGFHLRFDAKAVSNGPTILTTLGIFATFLGIALGLAQFDTANLQNSIPALLSGLKTAFWASVFGVGAALTVKLRDQLWGHRTDASVEDAGADASIGDIINGLSRVERALVGDAEGSLAGQLKSLRSELRDDLRQLKDAQTKSLEKLSEMGSKALIEALKDVIRDFNTKLTEQFGQNFAKLNDAVGKLVDWQDQYSGQVQKTVEAFNDIHVRLTQLTADYSKVVANTEGFARNADALKLTIDDLAVRHDELRKQNEALANLLDRAAGSLPEIEKKMVELARQLSDGLERSQKALNEALSAHTASIADGLRGTTEELKRGATQAHQEIVEITRVMGSQLGSAAQSIGKEIQEQQKTVSAAISTSLSELTTDVRRISTDTASVLSEQGKLLADTGIRTQKDLAQFAKEFTVMVSESQKAASDAVSAGATTLQSSLQKGMDTISSANSEYSRQMGDLITKSKDSILLLDKALEEELKKSLESLGRQLATLSERFVADYTPLTERLREIVRIAARADAT